MANWKTSQKVPLKSPVKTPKKGKNPLGRPKKARGAKNPFGNLGKVEKQPSRFAMMPNQGKRVTGQTLLQKAMGKMVQKSGGLSRMGRGSSKGGLVNKK